MAGRFVAITSFLHTLVRGGGGDARWAAVPVRYGIPALAEQETALDYLITLGYIIRPSRAARSLRAVLPPEPEWEREMDRR